MKRLPIVLRKNGFDYKQIKREEKKAIYEQSKDSIALAYEVFKVKIAKA